MMTIFWAITPLTSSIFATTRVTCITSTTAITTSSLLPIESQYLALTTGFMMTAYGIVWLEQALPSFTDYGGALIPFAMASAKHGSLADTNWTATTTMYKTTLGCRPAFITNSTSGAHFSNGNGCMINLDLPQTTDPTALYIGWYMDQNINYALSLMGCSSETFSHTFFAYFSEGADSTALFCEPSYWMQQVNTTIKATDMTALEISPLGIQEPLTDSLFNVSNFEYMIGTGAAFQSRRADVDETSAAIYQTTRLQDIGITGTSTDGNMVGYAFGITKQKPSDYLNSSTLASSFEKAHQLLFSLAIGSVLTTNSTTPDERPGTIQSSVNTIFVVRFLALLVECFLGIVVVLTMALLYTSWVRPSQLRHDPASLDDVLSMMDCNMPTSKNVEETMKSDEVLHGIVRQGKFTFRASQSTSKQRGLRSGHSETLSETTTDQIPVTKIIHVRPLELRLIVAAAFITILSLAVIVLVIVHVKAQEDLGMPQPSSNTVVNQLLTNYLPVVFATFLEPFWLLLNRILCILRPFEELRMGRARPTKSLMLKYTSLPPQLVIFRALHARHFLLAAICAVGLSANALSVALSGLFQTSIISIGAKEVFKLQNSPSFKQITSLHGTELYPSSDPLYVAKSNISDGTALPSWLSEDRYFMPFINNISGSDPSRRAKAVTQAFGANMTCAAIEYDTIPFIKSSEDYESGPSAAQVAVPRTFTEGRQVFCNNSNQGPDGGQNKSLAALEVILPLSATDPSTGNFCETLLLVGFLRANLSVSSNNVKTDNSDQPSVIDPDILAVNALSSLWMVCQPAFLTAPYSITVDDSGRVQEYTREGPYASSLDPFFSGNATVDSLFNQTGYLWGNTAYTRGYWHNDTFVDTWFAYFVKHLTNSTSFIDPTQAVPTFDAIAPVVEEVYERIFAITLSLQSDWFGEPKPEATIDGTIFTTQSRIFLSRPAYIITMTLLGFNILVAIAYYAKRPKRMLRRMPTTIASILELFDGSGLVKEASDAGGLKDEWKVGYGPFVGTDGRPRVGIERRPFVIPWGDGPS